MSSIDIISSAYDFSTISWNQMDRSRDLKEDLHKNNKNNVNKNNHNKRISSNQYDIQKSSNFHEISTTMLPQPLPSPSPPTSASASSSSSSASKFASSTSPPPSSALSSSSSSSSSSQSSTLLSASHYLVGQTTASLSDALLNVVNVTVFEPHSPHPHSHKHNKQLIGKPTRAPVKSLQKNLKSDTPILNHIFDSHPFLNRHHHHDFRYGLFPPI